MWTGYSMDVNMKFSRECSPCQSILCYSLWWRCSQLSRPNDAQKCLQCFSNHFWGLEIIWHPKFGFECVSLVLNALSMRRMPIWAVVPQIELQAAQGRRRDNWMSKSWCTWTHIQMSIKIFIWTEASIISLFLLGVVVGFIVMHSQPSLLSFWGSQHGNWHCYVNVHFWAYRPPFIMGAVLFFSLGHYRWIC